MPTTPNLALPFLEAAQAQKHVTHNAALTLLDAVVMLSIVDRDLTAPPASPADGSRYLVAMGASGAWSGHDGKIAAFADGAWAFHTPQEGWLAWIADEDAFIVFEGANWTGAATENAARLGINTTADTINRLAVSSSAVLFTHAGTNLQAKLNKAAASNTASIVFQTNWSGRAEIGCIGDDDFRFKVSADGSTFNTGLTLVAAAAGVPRLPSFTVAGLPSAIAAGAGAVAYVSNASGGAALAFSNGTTWRRADGSTLS
jgi:hypothetical protein